MRSVRLIGAALAVLSTHVAGAQITPGSTLTFTGMANAADIGLEGVMLDFAPDVTTAPPANSGSFSTMGAQSGTAPVGRIGGIRVGNGAEVIPDFLTIAGYRFDVAFLPEGGFGQDDCYVDPAPGQTCTPFQSVQGDPYVNHGLSPFFVQNVASGDSTAPVNSTAAFTVIGTVTSPDGYLSAFSGTIASAFVAQPYQYVLYTLEQDGLENLTFTGSFVAGEVLGRTSVDPPVAGSVVPEPATYALVATGLAGVAGVVRRRRRTA